MPVRASRNGLPSAPTRSLAIPSRAVKPVPGVAESLKPSGKARLSYLKCGIEAYQRNMAHPQEGPGRTPLLIDTYV
jgi:hypothetical protein